MRTNSFAYNNHPGAANGKPVVFMTSGTRWLLLTAAVLLCTGADAFAWGPATHIEFGDSILRQLGVLPAVIAGILSRHRVAYLYGNIAADVVFAKRWSRVKQFCHHWSTAFGLFDSAKGERDASFAYGYLSHLAADTVAHGRFVPRQIVLSRCSVNFGHFYWELRADAVQSDHAWGLLEEVLKSEHGDHHAILEGHITDTFLSYELNRMLFQRMNALAVRRGFRRTVGLWSRYSRWPLSETLLDGYRAESLERIRSVLTEGRRSPVLRDDPNGTSALMQLRARKRDAHRLRRVGFASEARQLEAVRGLAPKAKIEVQSSKFEETVQGV